MLLEAWYKSEKWLNWTDVEFSDSHCTRQVMENTIDRGYDYCSTISMKGCFMMYALHRFEETRTVRSRQDTDMAIMSFQMGGAIRVDEKNYEPYRYFENDLHITFYSTKRDLVFEAQPVFENFRIFLAPENFLTLLAKFHGKFSKYSEMIRRSQPFNVFDAPLPITPKMKMVIREILAHEIADPVLSKVFYDTKITELFGCQLEQLHSIENCEHLPEITSADREKISQARQILVQNIADPPTVGKLSRLAAINENKLKKGFKEIYGKSIYNYLLSFRIEKAIEMMANEKNTLDDIATEVGYGDAAHFSRAFRKVKGIPPGQFRKIQYNSSN